MDRLLDDRRHSVDIPLSKTLVALRRVRSLRDPSTNSMSKLTASNDHLEWETNSCSDIYLAAENGRHSPLAKEDSGSDQESNYSSRRPPRSGLHVSSSSAKIATRTRASRSGILLKEEQGLSRLSLAEIYEAQSSKESDSHCRRMKRESGWDLYLENSVKDNAINYSETTNLDLELLDMVDTTHRKRRSGCSQSAKSSKIGDDSVKSYVGTPASISDGQLETSNLSMPLFADQDMDILGASHHGCSIGCCWARTPKFKDSRLQPSLEDDNRLLLADKEIARMERHCLRKDMAVYSDGPQSLSDKYRPKSFGELVGQDVVAQSLLSAILQRKIASIYLFFGHRGTGKTSTARIFSAALNCLSAARDKPCGYCQQCVLFLSREDHIVRDVDAAKINHRSRIKALLKIASIAPTRSRFKVYIIDDCQLLKEEMLATLLSGIDELPEHAVFVLIADDLDKLPRNVVSRCQRYFFPKIRDADAVCKLTNICVQEGLEFDRAALEFIAGKSNGSLRDGETMLDQLSLLAKRINVPLVYELYGIVSDEELIDLLDLALSSDTSNTVKKARELMRSRIDPMQLASQLANLIMDILSGRCLPGNPEAGKNFLRKHSSDLDVQKLRHALRVLSETEKQLRTSKNQTTWLTVALLQFNGECSLSEEIASRPSLKASDRRDDGLCSKNSRVESVDLSVSHEHNHSGSEHSGVDTELYDIWRRAIEMCHSNKLRKFLEKEGRLSSVSVNEALAVAELHFSHPEHVSRAEKSWKLIASSLQLVLGRNVEIKISLAPCSFATTSFNVKRTALRFLGCSRGVKEISDNTSVDGDDNSDPSSLSSKTATRLDLAQQICSSTNLLAIRNIEGNALITGTVTPLPSIQVDQRNEVHSDDTIGTCDHQHNIGLSEHDTQPSCFSKTFKLGRVLNSSDTACTICLWIHPNNRFEVVPSRTSFDTYFTTNEPYNTFPSSAAHINSTVETSYENGSLPDSRVRRKINCWRAGKFPARKSWLRNRQPKRAKLGGSIISCSAIRKLGKGG